MSKSARDYKAAIKSICLTIALIVGIAGIVSFVPNSLVGKAHAYTLQADWEIGDSVQVLWKNQWYKAKILAVRGGKYNIHYDGYESSWDEWVEPARVKAMWNAGDRIEVLWKNQWYKAQVIDVANGKFQVHYDGYDNSWDEWVRVSRTRSRR